MTDQPMTEQQTNPAVAHHDDALDTHGGGNGAVSGAAAATTSDDHTGRPAAVEHPPAATGDEEPVDLNGRPSTPAEPPDGAGPTLEPAADAAGEDTLTLAEAVELVEPAEPAEAAQPPAMAEPAVEPSGDAGDPGEAAETAEAAEAAEPPGDAAEGTDAAEAGELAGVPGAAEAAQVAETAQVAEAAEAGEATTTAAEIIGLQITGAPATGTGPVAEAAVPPPSVLAAPPRHSAPRQAAAPVAPLPEHPPIVRPALTDPGRWGRIDGDRNVYVRTADGERLVGSWQAGEPEEGLAHFARRFDDLLTEVELIAARLASGHGDPKQSLTAVRQLKDGLAEAHVVGDVVGLDAKLDYLLAKAELAMGAAREAREAARTESTARKQTLVEEAEKIAAEATQWKQAGDRLREILDEWKTIRGVDRKVDDALWKRFGKARDAFNRRRGSHFAEMDRQRGAAKTRKEEIVAEAEELSQSSEWGATAGRYKQLMVDWKAAGRAPKDADDALWQRFRAAQDAFFARRSAAFTERDSELVDNARRKEELLAEADRINPAADLEAARAHLHRLQERWDAIGHVPRERMREFENRLRAVEERVRGAVDAQWRRTDPETEARVAQFRERVEQFESQAAKARAAGDERRAKRADEQAAQWREWLAAAEQAVADR
jgi:hypothetical protein